ncbi:hypothetical protein OW763_02305 [Clostridium aestuarii]|uniref:Uncharacterized protein n=1 Tax=Clostridium aestuarii TaxID=338193 RepID=A0ABT4CXU5_9CLOT|nr:hypothetical protein [Clostridium aestuarii]MCY6483187.1 hypothetical protein [Clostridium aestuarii]
MGNVEKNTGRIKNIEFQDIDMSDVLKAMPRDVIQCLMNNKKKISQESNRLRYEIRELTKELSAVTENIEKNRLNQAIKNKKQDIDYMNKILNEWTVNKYKDIENIVKQVLNKSIPQISKKDLDNMIIRFQSMLTNKKYLNTSLGEIIYKICKEHKKQMDKSYDKGILPVEVESEIMTPCQTNYEKKPLLKNSVETISPAEILTNVSRNLPNKPTSNVKIDVFYASIEKSLDENDLSKESFEYMLLKFLDLTSKFLYKFIQKQISELYNDFDKEDM